MSTTPSSRLARVSWLFASAASLALGGCFDSSDTPPPPPPPVASDEVPASAFASTDALFAFSLDLTSSANTVETTEPLKMDLVGDAPVSDTTEPTALP